ncbi:MAG: molybdopterin-guanine dinucleotide biosynthesis protein B [Thermoprotei archaeon]|nr:MAG: molybdopterin-guanine dinucleotide biosynthesis protein B [Thermoprotei archaeon]
MLRAIGFIGYKGSGKTTAIIKVARILKERGYKIAIIKHMPEHDIDKHMSDTYRLRQVSPNVIAITQSSIVIFRKRSDNPVEVLMSVAPKVDFVLVEGLKECKLYPRIICAREIGEVGKLMNGLEIAVVGPISEDYEKKEFVEKRYGLRVFNVFNEANTLADIIERKAFMLPGMNCGMCGYDCYTMAKLIVKGERTVNDCKALGRDLVNVIINGKPMILNAFVQKLIRNTVIGMLSTLKGFEKGEIVIRIRR